jgi:hypothetical protein
LRHAHGRAFTLRRAHRRPIAGNPWRAADRACVAARGIGVAWETGMPTRSSLRACLAVLVATTSLPLVACGGNATGPAGPNAAGTAMVNGSVGGVSLAPKTAIAHFGTLYTKDVIDATGTETKTQVKGFEIVLIDSAATCVMTMDPPAATVAILQVVGTGPATFAVKDANAASPVSGQATVDYFKYDKSLAQPNILAATANGGSVVLDAVNPGATGQAAAITGHFDLQYGKDVLTGSFDAVFCNPEALTP